MQARDEVWLGRCFAEGGDEVVTVRIHQRAECRAYCESASFYICERDVARVIRLWAGED